MVDTTIIIPTFNRNISANTCVKSILTSNVSNIEIIIVNDYKDVEFLLDAENVSTKIRVVNNPKQGVASARNYGASLANSANLIFVDDDMILNSQAIFNAIDFLNTTQKSTYNANWIYEEKLVDKIVKTQFGRYLIKYNFTTLKGWNSNSIEWKNDTLIKSNGITSQFLAIKKADFEILGRYNEDFPFAGFEDYEFYKRFSIAKFSNYIDTRVLIYHNEIDRVNPSSWLQRQQRGARTRKVAIQMGHQELIIKYSVIKGGIYFILSKFSYTILSCLSIMPNNKIFDVFYFKLMNVLLGINIYVGYHKK